jgi:hypothetical protein
MTQQADSISRSFDAALCESNLATLSLEARAAIGRLVALELASYLVVLPTDVVNAADGWPVAE